MARKKKKANTAPALDDAISSFGAHAASIKSDEPVEGTGPGHEGPSIADVLAQLKQTNERLDAAERANLALMAQPTQTETTRTNSAPALDLTKDMPDPTLNPELYGAEVSKRVAEFTRQSTEAATRSVQNQGQNQQRLDALWEAFNKKYPDLAENPEWVEFASAKVAAEAKELGMDVQKYMFTTRDKFLADVANKVKETFGPAMGEDDDDTEVEETNRTGGIFGSTPAGKKPAARPDPGDMVKELQDTQRKSGFF